ncbi:MAG: GAF domain-containing protein [Cyanobacteria bacterium P01_C01_bin.120]
MLRKQLIKYLLEIGVDMSSKSDYEENQELRQLQLIGEVARSILSPAVHLEQIFQTILNESLQLIGAQHGNLLLVEGDEVVVRATTSQFKQEEIGTRLKVNNSVSGLSVIRKEAVLISDVEQEPRYQYVFQNQRMRTELAVPLIENGKVIGVLNLESPKLKAFNQHHKELLQALADLATIAINNFNASELRALRKIDSAILSSTNDLNHTLQTILNESLKLINAQYGHLTLVEGPDLVIRATNSHSKEREIGRKLRIENSVSGKAISQKRAVLISNVDEEPVYQRVLTDDYMRSEIVVPLIDDDRAIGVINIESPRLNAFTLREQELLEAIANHAVLAVKNARNHQELKILREIDCKILSSTFDLEQTLQIILNESLRLIDAKYGLLLLVKGEELIIKATTTHFKEKDLEKRLKIDNSISGKAVVQKNTILISNVDEEPLYQRVLRDEYMRSNIAVPLMNDDRVLGVLNIESPRINAFSKRDKDLLEAMANQAVIAIREAQNKQILKELQKIDEDILGSSSNLNEILRDILGRILKLVDADFCDVSVVEGGELIIKVSTLKTFFRDKLHIENSITGLAVKQADTLFIPDVDRQPLYQKSQGARQMKSELVVPMFRDGAVVGALNVESIRPNAFTEQDIEIVRALAGHAAIAIRNAQYVEELKQAELVKANAETALWITHKISNLAFSIEWPVDRLRHEIDSSNSSALEDLDIIHHSARKIIELKNQLMTPFRPKKEETVSIEEIFDESIRSTQTPREIIQKNVAYNLPMIKASKIDMLDIFSELLSNAMNAMEEVVDKQIEFSAYLSSENKKSVLVVKLTDNGYGIQHDNIDKIWALGFTTKREQGGTGFGMYKCTQLLYKIGARISVESEIGQGTIFTLHFPIETTFDILKEN